MLCKRRGAEAETREIMYGCRELKRGLLESLREALETLCHTVPFVQIVIVHVVPVQSMKQVVIIVRTMRPIGVAMSEMREIDGHMAVMIGDAADSRCRCSRETL